MGFVVSKAMNDRLKGQQEFMRLQKLYTGEINSYPSFPVYSMSALLERIQCLNSNRKVCLDAYPCILITASVLWCYAQQPGWENHSISLLPALERQLVLQNLMRERQTAMQIAWTREFLKYFGTFSGLAAVVLTAGAIKRKNPAILLPMLPLGFVFSYQYDMGYGTLSQRIKGEAENILDTESSLLELPKGPLTFEDLEKIRISQSKFFIEK